LKRFKKFPRTYQPERSSRPQLSREPVGLRRGSVRQNIPPDLINNINEPVLRHIRDLSAHSDIAQALLESVKPLGDVQTFCPDASQYRYVIVSTRHIIFGLAIGMNEIAYRLDARMKGRALATGGVTFSACGDDWVCFTPFRDDWPRVDLQFWALKAYVFARETKIVQ
jgi:hypothetical protein